MLHCMESQGFDRKEAMKKAAKDRGVSKRDIYQSRFKKYWKTVDN